MQVIHSASHSFLTWKIYIILQVVVVGRIHSITPSLPVRHLEIWGGGGGGAPIWKGKEHLLENFELKETYVAIARASLYP